MNQGTEREVLLTGATGFVGKVVLETLLRRRYELGLRRIRVLVRAGDERHAAARLRELLRSPCFDGLEPGWEQLVVPIAGDVTRSGFGLASEAREQVARSTSWLIHCAASVEFDLPLAEAYRVNTGGARHALELARACPRLTSFVDVSTAYVTPHPRPGERRAARADETLAPLPVDAAKLAAEIESGRADEAALLARTGHPNTYTLTKSLAEHLLARGLDGLPLTIVRPSIVSASRAHPRPGWIDSAAAFGGFVVLIGTGRLRVVAGDPRARLDVVPCDEVANRIVEAALDPPARGTLRIRHAVAGLDGALPIALCRERIVDWFSRHPVGGAARVHFVGRSGPLFRTAHALGHELPGLGAAVWLALRRRANEGRAVRKLLERQRAINRDFAYFTHATFDFAASRPLDPPLDPAAYLELVCEGVSRHLLRRERRTRRGTAPAPLATTTAGRAPTGSVRSAPRPERESLCTKSSGRESSGSA
ncbi:MAG: fatty acyl-CoA reductase [Myxococcota bacterium]